MTETEKRIKYLEERDITQFKTNVQIGLDMNDLVSEIQDLKFKLASIQHDICVIKNKASR